MARLTRNLDEDRWLDPAAPFFSASSSVRTEMTKTDGAAPAAGWLAYDDTCGFCVRWARRAQGVLLRRGVRLAPLSMPWVRKRLGLRDGERAEQMWLMLSDGRDIGGADAAIELGRRVWWAWPLAMIAGLPGVRGVMRWGYRRIAARRTCVGKVCLLDATGSPLPVVRLAMSDDSDDAAGGGGMGEERNRRAADGSGHWQRTASGINTGSAKPQAAGGAGSDGGKRHIPRGERRPPGDPPTWVAAIVDVAPLFVLTLGALYFAQVLPAWGYMWTLTLSIFGGLKWLMFRRAARDLKPALWRSFSFLFLWPGMNSWSFLDAKKHAARPTLKEWRIAATNTLVGIALIWGCVRLMPENLPIITGWVGMVGLSFTAHFGLFRVAEMVWRSAGVAATPMMLMPVGASSLADFWGRRWNKDFTVLAHELIFGALNRRMDPTRAMVIVFVLSGLIHDVVVSVPSGGGFGLPTAYFLLQAAGLWFERTPYARRAGFGRGTLGWLYMAGFTIWAIPLLFHAPFVMNVILPFLEVLGAR